MISRCICVTLCVLAACGGDGGGGGGGGTDSGIDSPRSVDAAGSSDKKSGVVEIFEQTLAPIGTYTFEGADFTDASAVPGMIERVDGSCVIRKIDVASRGMAVSAGTVTINGAHTLTPDAGNRYSTDSQQGTAFTSGTILTINATGATVPAFNGTVTYPGVVTVASPPPLSKSGYAVSWTGGDPVRVMISQSSNVLIQCDYPYTTTSASIPASALSDLMTGTGSDMQITILIGGLARTQLSAGAYHVELLALKAGYATVTFLQ